MSIKQQFRQIKKLPDWIYWLPAKTLLLLRYIMRTEIVDPLNLMATQKPPVVTVTWHNRLLFFPAMFPKRMRKHTIAVISASRDGQYIADLVKQFEVGSVRGSSSRRAAQVLHGAIVKAKEGKYISFTPDGPRGPKYTMSRGPIHLASQMQIPLIPIGINYSSYWELKSWDAFQIPKPWAKVSLVIGTPVLVPPNLEDDEIEHWRKLAEDSLKEITWDKKKPEKP